MYLTGGKLQCCFGFCPTTWISHNLYISPSSWACLHSLPSHPIPLGHHRAPSSAPYAIQQLPTSYLYYTWQYIYVSATFSIRPTLSLPHCVHKSVLHSFTVNKLGWTMFSSDHACLVPSAVFREKATAPDSSTLAWKIPWMEEPGRLQSMGLWRVRHDWATSLSLFTFMHWRRKWQPTPVFLPEESQGQGCLVGCHLWGRTELDMTEAT